MGVPAWVKEAMMLDRRMLGSVLALLIGGVFALGAGEPQSGKQGDKDKEEVVFPKPEPKGNDGALMVFIPAGCFTMGTNNIGSDPGQGFPNESPEHEVCLKDYYFDQLEVTVTNYAKFMEASKYDPPSLWDDDALTTAPDRPVVDVSWHDAEAYCKWASKRLPTEAEWEKAARGNEARRFPWGFMTPYPDLANYNRGDWVSYPVTLAPVTYGASGLNIRLGIQKGGGRSAYGIYNMAGNANEWVADWYDREYYKKNPPKDNPKGMENGSKKVYRGGSWIDPPRYLRATVRFSAEPDFHDRTMGFRCAMDAGK